MESFGLYRVTECAWHFGLSGSRDVPVDTPSPAGFDLNFSRPV